MVFSSMTFIFIFLPSVVVFYYLVPSKPGTTTIKNIILCVFSLVFYAWGEPIYIIIMLISIVYNFYIAFPLQNTNNSITFRRALLFISIVINLSALIIFKYCVFLDLPLPVGISFYTFQSLSYIIDVYRKKVSVQKKIINLALYVSLFPQLIAGPIVRYSDIEKEIVDRKHTLDNFIDGLKQFMIGLGLKVIIANNMALVADTVINEFSKASVLVLWIGAIAYAFQIYFDFSGYSRMAIGLGRMFGFTFPENFNYPYIANSITDFWRRWHITLSSWFRDYVYIPLGGNRCSSFRWVFNILITWLLTGIWHGASINFLFWGVYYAFFLVLEKLVIKPFVFDRFKNPILKIFSRICTLLIILIGWLIFRIENIEQLFQYITRMFGLLDPVSLKVSTIDFITSHADSMSKIIFLPLAFLGSTPVIGKLFVKINVNKFGYITETVFTFIIFCISVCLLIASTYNPFIYFRF